MSTILSKRVSLTHQIQKVVNKSEELLDEAVALEKRVTEIEESSNQKNVEGSRKRAFYLQDVIIVKRERLDFLKKEWEEIIWDSDNEKRKKHRETINEISGSIHSYTEELDNILDNISGELRAEWAKDYFGR